MSRYLWVIDDDADVREVFAYALENEGHLVRTFDSAETALAHLSVQDAVLPGLIIVDLMMPKMDGLQFIQHLRRTHLIPVALNSAKAADELGPELPPGVLTLGKPTNLETILQLARTYCG
jgi:DNA-binding NtrC family response regulator